MENKILTKNWKSNFLNLNFYLIDLIVLVPERSLVVHPEHLRESRHAALRQGCLSESPFHILQGFRQLPNLASYIAIRNLKGIWWVSHIREFLQESDFLQNSNFCFTLKKS